MLSKVDWSGFSNETTWKWIEILFVPILLAIATFYFNFKLFGVQDFINKKKIEQDRIIEYMFKTHDILNDNNKENS